MKGFNRLLSLILGLVVAGAAAVVGVEAVLLAAGQQALVVPRGEWDRYLGGAVWSSTWIEVPAIIAAAAGAIIVAAQVIPRRPARLLARSTSGREIWISRRSLARRAATAATDVPGVADAHAKLNRRRVTTKVTAVAGRSPGGLRPEVDHAVVAAFDDLGARTRRRPKTKVRPATEKLP